MLSIGQRFPDVPLVDMQGERAPVSAHGTPLLVCVAHSECGTSALVLPYVDRMHRRGGRVLAVLQDDEPATRQTIEQLGLALPVRRDEEPYALGEALGLVSVPVLYLLDGGSRVRRLSEGFRRQDVEELARELGVPGPFFAPADGAPALRPG